MTDNEPRIVDPWVPPVEVPAPDFPVLPRGLNDDASELLRDAADAAADVRAARALVLALTARRDARIRRALEGDPSARLVARVTHLTPNQIGRIRVGQTSGRLS